MNSSRFFMLTALIVALPTIVDAAPRNRKRTQAQTPVQVIQIPVAPASTNPTSQQEAEDRVLFTNCIGILGNFANILLDPNDKTQVVGNVGGMVQGMVNIAQQLLRLPMDAVRQQKLIKNLAVALSNAEIRQNITRYIPCQEQKA